MMPAILPARLFFPNEVRTGVEMAPATHLDKLAAASFPSVEGRMQVGAASRDGKTSNRERRFGSKIRKRGRRIEFLQPH